jgi:hypothetical protein
MFHGEPASLESIGGVLREVRAASARGIIQLSVLTMIATPVMRVAFAVYGFTRQRQWVFTAINLTVLALLVFGLFYRPTSAPVLLSVCIAHARSRQAPAMYCPAEAGPSLIGGQIDQCVCVRRHDTKKGPCACGMSGVGALR